MELINKLYVVCKKERNFNMRTKKFGFTLAEVLITLGIIGVVAAMTIPTLISNTNSAKFKSQYKKTLSTLNQAALMATAQYDLDYASLTADCGGATDKPDVTASMCALINGTLSGATYYSSAASMKIPGTSSAYSITGSSAVAKATWPAYQLADGSVVGFTGVKSCTLEVGGDVTAITSSGTVCTGFIDVNGPTLPNKEVQCGGSGTTAIASSVGTCIVRNNAADMGDIFPVVFHDGTVEPLTNAARYVLNQSK